MWKSRQLLLRVRICRSIAGTGKNEIRTAGIVLILEQNRRFTRASERNIAAISR